MSSATLMSVEQFAAMPRDEAVDYELVEGELVEVSSPIPGHGLIAGGLLAALWVFLSRNALGVVMAEINCRTTGETVRKPDISFITRERWALVDENRVPLPFAPDIAIEVLSPSEIAIDVNRKVREYLAGGSQEVWILDSENVEVFVHTATGIGQLAVGGKLESPLLPGFSVDVAETLRSSKTPVQ